MRDKWTKPLSVAIVENERRVCRNCGGATRTRISGLCLKCSHIKNYHGHEKAYPLLKKDYECELEDVKQLLSLNSDHSGFVYALNWCNQFVENCKTGVSQVPCADEYLGLVMDKGVSGFEVLLEAGALQLLYHRFPNKILSLRHLTTLTGIKILRLRKLSATTYGRLHREVGQFIRDGIGVLFLHNIAKSCQRREEFKQQRLKEQGQELKIL
jgi:hypothetical protein